MEEPGPRDQEWRCVVPKRVVLMTVALAVCASMASAQELITVSKEKVLGEPSSQEAVVYFVRPAIMGKAVKIWAFVDQTVIGANKGKHYTFAKVPAGKHLFWAKAENLSALELDVEAGQTYYLKQKVKMGGLKARVKLMEIDTAEGNEALDKCKYTSLTDAGQQRGAEIVAEKHAVAVEKAAKREAG